MCIVSLLTADKHCMCHGGGGGCINMNRAYIIVEDANHKDVDEKE